MSVSLWFSGTEVLPGGFSSNYNTVEEALNQAVADVASERVPQPDRIVAEDGTILHDYPSICAAVSTE